MAEFGEWRHYPVGTLKVSGQVDEVRSTAKADASRHGFDDPDIIFIPNTTRDIAGMYLCDLVGWYAKR